MNKREELTVASLIRSAASDHPDIADPKDLVPYVMEAIAGQEEVLLRKLLPTYISGVLRRRLPTTDDNEAWEALLGERVPTESGVIFLRDATADDLDAGAERRRKFAGNLDGRAAQYASVAAAVRSAGALTVGALAVEDGVRTLRELEARIVLAAKARRRGVTRVRHLAALRAAREKLQGILDAGNDPRLPLLVAYRDDLLKLREDLVHSLERGKITDEVLSGSR